MGRGCTMDEWEHFQKLPEEGRVPNSSYWYVLCRHCVRGFEEKQLFNEPAKLTGRRSAMSAHLKICPMYATQYKMEQAARQAKAAAAAAAAATGQDAPNGAPNGALNGAATGAAAKPPTADENDAAAASTTTPAPSGGEKRKRKATDGSGGSRGGRGKHCMMEEWKHFVRLQEDGYIGNSNFFRAVCRHCQRAYDDASEEQKPLLVPERLVGRREKMRKHLSLCPHFQGELPPLERRSAARGGVSASAVFSALAASAEAPAASAAATPSGSSRLALDEWNYFTRLHRKKDSAYYYARCNFCQQARDKAPEPMKAAMEPTLVMGRKSNMQTHLAKCPYVPKDALALAKAYSAAFPGVGYNLHLGGLAATSSASATTRPAAPKRVKTEPPATATASTDDSSVHRALVEFLLEHGLAFEWVESASAKKLFRALAATQNADTQAPSATELRTRVLDELLAATAQSELAKLQELIPSGLGTAAFSGESDTLADAVMPAWPVTLQCSLRTPESGALLPQMDGAVTDGKALAPLSLLAKERSDADAARDNLLAFHGLEVARWVDQQLRRCVHTAKLAPATVVLPYSLATHRAAAILRAPTRWPHVAFISNVADLLAFPLAKTLATAELYAVMSSLVELWRLEAIRECVGERLAAEPGVDAKANPFEDWKACTALMQVLLDDKTFAEARDQGTAAHAKKLVDATLGRSLLERVYPLLRAFATAFESCRVGLTLSESLVQLGALFKAADGFPAVQLALEVVWAQLEQPLFVLAHALNPRVRLSGLHSTELTKLSVLSDLSVSYFSSLFGRKPSSLRGEVTAYLHTSQPVFAPPFVGEFPVVADYFRYLSDDYPSLSMLMRVLHSLSSVEVATRPAGASTKDRSSSMFSSKEARELEFLRGRWGVATSKTAASSASASTGNTSVAMGALSAGSVVDKWKEALETSLQARAVEFTLLDAHFDAAEESGLAVLATDGGDASSVAAAVSDVQTPLPCLPTDDETLFPPTPLRLPFAKKVPLKELFKAAEATI